MVDSCRSKKFEGIKKKWREMSKKLSLDIEREGKLNFKF
jgi:hypothetical protein